MNIHIAGVIGLLAGRTQPPIGFADSKRCEPQEFCPLSLASSVPVSFRWSFEVKYDSLRRNSRKSYRRILFARSRPITVAFVFCVYDRTGENLCLFVGEKEPPKEIASTTSDFASAHLAVPLLEW